VQLLGPAAAAAGSNWPLPAASCSTVQLLGPAAAAAGSNWPLPAASCSTVQLLEPAALTNTFAANLTPLSESSMLQAVGEFQ
jgi:hypothetical protein